MVEVAFVVEISEYSRGFPRIPPAARRVWIFQTLTYRLGPFEKVLKFLQGTRLSQAKCIVF